METVKDRVQKVLQKQFSPKEIILQSAGGGMVGGWIISKSFEELDEVERQQKVWKLFDAYLTEKDRGRIVGFLTFTPLEKKLAFDDDFNNFAAPSKRAKKPMATRGNGVMKRKTMSQRKQTAAAR